MARLGCPGLKATFGGGVALLPALPKSTLSPGDSDS